MAVRTNLDMDVLRTIVAGFDLGSFARAADRLGRSQSAISTQLRRLEAQVGQPLVQKAGRGLKPTLAGENLLGYARRILELNDEAVAMLHDSDVAGWVRLGVPQDFAESALPAVLGRFARAHPKVRIEARADRNFRLVESIRRGDLDLALTWSDGDETAHAERIAQVPIAWIAHPECAALETLGREPLPLVAFDQPCIFRSAGVTRLDTAGIPWRLVFTSPSLSALWAATDAGLGIALRTPVGMPKSLAVLDPAAHGLPALPTTALSLHRAEAEPAPAVARLGEILKATVVEATQAQ